MIFDDEQFQFEPLGLDFAKNLEKISEIISLNEENSEEINPLENCIDILGPLYFSSFNQYLKFLLLFLFSEQELILQRGELSIYPFLEKKEEDLILLTNETIFLPKTVQSFFSRFWNLYGFTYEKFFLTEELLGQKMHFEALNSKLDNLEIGTKTKVTQEKLDFLLSNFNSGLFFLHNSLCFRGRFYSVFYNVSSFSDLKCDFFQLILSIDYGNCLVALELIKLKAKYNRILNLNSK